MKIYPRTRPIQRYIALDIHKQYVLVGGMNVGQEWILPPRRITISKFGKWVEKNLCESNAVVIETTTNVRAVQLIYRLVPRGKDPDEEANPHKWPGSVHPKRRSQR